MAEINCRFFSGYKPCGKNAVCDSYCSTKEEIQNRILIIHLGALGAVVRAAENYSFAVSPVSHHLGHAKTGRAIADAQ